ncbi:MAG: hypothetical protein P8L77_00580 [Gammaproteobacteria bacterium]|nr:hypothetical protein [Gammaproteobacteria bacterium]
MKIYPNKKNEAIKASRDTSSSRPMKSQLSLLDPALLEKSQIAYPPTSGSSFFHSTSSEMMSRERNCNDKSSDAFEKIDLN